MKLTVFTYSEIYLINYFNLEVVAWDYILAVILLFGQCRKAQAHQKLCGTSILTMPDILKEKKILLNRF